jgi:hypothetical protein
MTGRTLPILVILATALGAAGGCLVRGDGVPDDLPAGWAVVEARPGDTPWSVSKRVYGRNYLEYQIRRANEDRLQEDGSFAPGTKVLVPPDLRGRSVDPRQFEH